MRQVAVDFAEPRVTSTKSFERYVLELCRSMTIKDVAVHLGISWDVVKDIQKRDLKRRFSRPRLKDVRRIAIDEISIGKGHRYLTIVLDLESGAVVYVGHGKGGDALLEFWQSLRRSRARIEAVATDMSPAYIDAVRTHLPAAKLVFDRFHVMKLFNEKLSELRREAYHITKNTMQKDVLKGTRWLLLKRPENLDESRNERKRLEEALRLNQPLATAYYLKEELADSGSRRMATKPKRSCWTGSAAPSPAALACCTSSLKPSASTLSVSLPITTTPSRPVLSRAPITKSKL